MGKRIKSLIWTLVGSSIMIMGLFFIIGAIDCFYEFHTYLIGPAGVILIYAGIIIIKDRNR